MGKKGKRKAPQKKAQKRTKKKRATAAKRNASREVMNRPVALSAELAEVVGAQALSRPEAVKRLWAYCRKKDLLNPKDKRQILCDKKLQKLLGKKTANLFGLQGLLAPHFDFSASVDEAEGGMDEEEEEEDDDAGDEEDEEQTGSGKHAMKSRHAAGRAANPDAEEVARRLVMRVSKLEAKTLTLNFTVTAQQLSFEAVATPVSKAAAATRAAFSLQHCQGADGDVETSGEARLDNLDPSCSYKVAVEVRGTRSNETACSAELVVPQRAQPGKWSAREAQIWCQSLQVPDLASKVKEYNIDGNTLLSLTEEDIRGLGISMPFVVRRVLSALKALGGA